MRSNRRRVIAFGVASMILAGACAATSTPPASTPPASTASASSSPSVVATGSPEPSATPSPATASPAAAACVPPGVAGYPHQAPEIEAVLPAAVAGRDLTRWSVRGRCWLEIIITNDADIDPFVAHFRTTSNPDPANETGLVYGVAGRSSLASDPPFFVYAAVRPADESEIALALALLFGGAGYKNEATAADLSLYEQATIGGKQVYVGTLEMLAQDSHQRGRPYLYQTNDYMFLVVTDDAAWAADAIGQLP